MTILYTLYKRGEEKATFWEMKDLFNYLAKNKIKLSEFDTIYQIESLSIIKSTKGRLMKTFSIRLQMVIIFILLIIIYLVYLPVKLLVIPLLVLTNFFESLITILGDYAETKIKKFKEEV